MTKIDINSKEFQAELENTKIFTDKVCEQHNLVYNPDIVINESIQQGLTRNKMMYGKRFCPCFMVIGKTKEEQDSADNRICPCEPALKNEIPNNGTCHCTIFCTPEYIEKITLEKSTKVAAHTHSRCLKACECDHILNKSDINNDELQALLQARSDGLIDFVLLDVREWMEWKSRRIEGTDYLIPTSSFYNKISELDDKKDKTIIIYCYSGSRSKYCQQIMYDFGFEKVINFDYGIMSFRGNTIKGE